MKSIKIIIAAILTIQTGILFAGNERMTPVTEVIPTVNILLLLPSVPCETTLEDTFIGLSPVTPAVESSSEMVSFTDLTPVIPFEVDIMDAEDQTSFDLHPILPFVPVEVDFE